jgi:hypothetical protein
MNRFLLKLAVVATILSLLGFGALVARADAINPTQTTVTGVVNYEYWDLAGYWGGSQPNVQYYNYYSNGRWIASPPCGSQNTSHWGQGFYCPGTRTIYLDFSQQQSNLGRFGDGSVGFWLAHEYAHHVQVIYNQSRSLPRHELLADCFAGMYVRYGVTRSFRLAYNDYLEARNQIWALSWNDADHGTPAQRLAAFDYGYSTGSWSSCISAY